MNFQIQRRRIDKIPRDALLAELEAVAAKLDFVEFGKRDFPKHGHFSAGPVVKEFGSWSAAISALRQRLSERGIDLGMRSRGYSDRTVFAEIERIWLTLGHRPSRTEWEAANPRISYSGIKHHFGGWVRACLKFVEFKMGALIAMPQSQPNTETLFAKLGRQNPEYKRDIPLALRLKVLQRDGFRCVFCGLSPATHLAVSLHIDHRIAFSNGGRTTLDNLQTLCHDCNLGKGKQIVHRT